MKDNKIYIYRDDQRKQQAEVKFVQETAGYEGLDNVAFLTTRR